MTVLANERIAYFNGNYVPEREVVVSFRDASFIGGDAGFDTTRTFNKRIFKLDEHLDRFYRTLRYLDIDPGLSKAEMKAISIEVFERNRHLLGPDEDYWLSQRVTRGQDKWAADGVATPTVIVECQALPYAKRAPLYRDGIEVIVPSIRRTPPDALSPQAKTHNYLNLIMADREVKAHNPKAWAVLLDAYGNLTEGLGSNLFLVSDGRLLTPRTHFVLPGISRQTVYELAEDLGIPLVEKDIDLFDAYNADEAFLTSTSLCICPVKSINGRKPADKGIPGPVTKRLLDAYSRLVDCDIAGQYLKHLKD
ncbi:aminotransferase class IV [Zavarzinia sp. CC-PAN008]|uniref:aminotransferase class IV n=1 Tax=Zavarzinia sp. CC-PAN008 TaxID=3243332 RepID=UPI003F743CC0